MADFIELLQALIGVPLNQAGALIVLAAFGLAAFAIYAVLSATRERR